MVTTTVYLLFIQLSIGGAWVDGYTVEGWSPRAQPSAEICKQRARNVTIYGDFLRKGPILLDGKKIEGLRAWCHPFQVESK